MNWIKKNKKRNVTKAFTTGAIIAGGLSIPMAHGVAHADEISNENPTNVIASNENNIVVDNTPSTKEIINDVFKESSAENDTVIQPETNTSKKTNVESVQAPKEWETNKSNEVE